jgi:hypothetical protein
MSTSDTTNQELGDPKLTSPTKQLNSQLTGGVSNVLKQMYTLKYMQRQTVSNCNPTSVQQSVSNPSTDSPSSNAFQYPTSKQFWMPDDQVKECFECNDKFTMFNRRHVSVSFLNL